MVDTLSTPQIEGSRIILRYAQAADLDDYFAFLQDPEMNRLTGSQRKFTREEIAAWLQKIGIRSEDRADFIIVAKETGELAGEVVLNELDEVNRSANIRIALDAKKQCGRGFGSEALLHMLRYGFDTLGLHRIHLGVYAFNPRAIHVYRKLGFQQEGIERDALYLDGEFHDMILMAMLEDEFRSLHGSGPSVPV